MASLRVLGKPPLNLNKHGYEEKQGAETGAETKEIVIKSRIMYDDLTYGYSQLSD